MLIALANPKGGTGKTTIAAAQEFFHLYAHIERQTQSKPA
jgi:hypothetical protein